MKKGKGTKLLVGLLCAVMIFADLGSAGLLSLAEEVETAQETEVQTDFDENESSALKSEIFSESVQMQSVESLENDTEMENQMQTESVSENVEIVETESVETEANAEDISESEVEETETQVVLDADGNIASGVIDEDYGHITWVIDANGKLMVEGTGDFAKPQYYYTDNYYPERAPWYSYRESIKSVKINVTKMIDASFMFAWCENITKMREFQVLCKLKI